MSYDEFSSRFTLAVGNPPAAHPADQANFLSMSQTSWNKALVPSSILKEEPRKAGEAATFKFSPSGEGNLDKTAQGLTAAHKKDAQARPDKSPKHAISRKKHKSYAPKTTNQRPGELSSRSKRHLSKWQDHVRSSFVRIYETTLTQSQMGLSGDSAQSQGCKDQQTVKLLNKDADRFLTATEVSKVHAQFGDSMADDARRNKGESKQKVHCEKSVEQDVPSGCFIVAFKSQLKNLSHVVTFQGHHPLSSSLDDPNPIGYYEVKILNMESKEPSQFGVGLAGYNFQMLKSVGSDRSVALRGSAKICYLNTEERVSLSSLQNADFRKQGTTVGIGYIFRTQKVFFTMNGKEIYQMNLPECMMGLGQLYPTVSLGSLRDRVQVNFGQGKTHFRFDLASKVQVYYKNIFNDIVTQDFGKVSQIFEQKQPTALELAKDYLYSQGYFKTLGSLRQESTKPEVRDQLEQKVRSCKPLINNGAQSKEPQSQLSLKQQGGVNDDLLADEREELSNLRKSSIQDSAAIFDKQARNAATPNLMKLERAQSSLKKHLQPPEDILRVPEDNERQRRDTRQGSFLTDKEPSYIQPNDASFSERGGENAQPEKTLGDQEQPAGAIVSQRDPNHLGHELARSQTMQYAIVKEFSFGGAGNPNHQPQNAMLERNGIIRLSGFNNQNAVELSQNSLLDEKPGTSMQRELSQAGNSDLRESELLTIQMQLIGAKGAAGDQLSENIIKKLPLHALRAHTLTLLKQAKPGDALDFLKRHVSDFLKICKPAVRSSILSLQFVAHLRAKEHLQAIELIQKSELKSESFVSIDETGKLVVCRGDDLTRLFCQSQLSEGDPGCLLVGKAHRQAVIDFVNKEMLLFERRVKIENSAKLAQQRPQQEDQAALEHDTFGFEVVHNPHKSQGEQASKLKKRRDLKRDSKLEVMLKQTCLTLTHLNQTVQQRQQAAELPIAEDIQQGAVMELGKRRRDKSGVLAAAARQSKLQTEQLIMDQHTGIQLKHHVSDYLSRL